MIAVLQSGTDVDHSLPTLTFEKNNTFVSLWNCAVELRKLIEIETECLSEYQIENLTPIIHGKALMCCFSAKIPRLYRPTL